MRKLEKRQRLIEYLNFITHRKHRAIHSEVQVYLDFIEKTNIVIPPSTAYRIIKKYMNSQHELLHAQVNDEILQIYNN